MPSDSELLLHINEYGRVVRDLVNGITREEFDSQKIVQLAVTHALQIIGEAARQVSQAGRDRYPEVPWRQIVGMRNRIVHEYFQVNLDLVWHSAIKDVPELLRLIDAACPPGE